MKHPHGVFATWLHMVTRIPTEMTEIPTKLDKFLPDHIPSKMAR